jgi:hypothetical protein
MTLSNKKYDVLKWIAQYFLPALAALWLGLAKVWGFPYGTEIGATLSLIDVFLGAVLGISSKNYKGDGDLVINTEDPEKDVYSLELNGDISELAEKKSVTFKVKG